MNDEENKKSTYERYKEELSEELDLTDFNIKDIQMKLPGIKHKWVARLIDQKIELNNLKRLKQNAIETLIEKIRKESLVSLSDNAYAKQAENYDIVKKINKKIFESEIIIDYLEKVEKVCSSTTFDIKNLIKIKEMELG